jgi:hypothetical protein
VLVLSEKFLIHPVFDYRYPKMGRRNVDSIFLN